MNTDIKLSANEETVLTDISGNSLELELEYSEKSTRCPEFRVLRSENGAEYSLKSHKNFSKRGMSLCLGKMVYAVQRRLPQYC